LKPLLDLDTTILPKNVKNRSLYLHRTLVIFEEKKSQVFEKKAFEYRCLNISKIGDLNKLIIRGGKKGRACLVNHSVYIILFIRLQVCARAV